MNKENWIIPLGVNFKFTVKPSVNSNQEGLKYAIKMKSGLNQYFKNIDVFFYDGCYVDNEGRTISDNELEGKQMVIKVFCPETIIKIERNNEDYFYEQLKEKFSECIIEIIQSNIEIEHSAKLEAFLYVNSYKL